MAVNVRRGGDVAVAKPLLDQLHFHALRDQERRAGVSQVMESELPISALCRMIGGSLLRLEN